jgi:hypothetical protein
MIFKNQSVRMYFTTGIDDVETTEVLLKYRKRDGSEFSRSDVTVDVAAEGKYYVDWAADELDELKTWSFWSYVTTISGVFPGIPFQYTIHPEGAYPVSKEFIKEFLGITDTSKDAKIDALIPLLIEQFKEIRFAPFPKVYSEQAQAYVDIYPEGMATTIAYMFDYMDKQSESGVPEDLASERIGSYSYSKGKSSSDKGAMGFYPSFITSQIKRMGRIL